MRVFPHVVPLPGYSYQAEAYLVVLPGGEALLVDTGPDQPGALEALEGTLRSAGMAWPDIRHILLTHGHYDHFGLATRILALTDACVWVHPADLGKISAPLPNPLLVHREAASALLARLGASREDAERMLASALSTVGYSQPVPAGAIRLLSPGAPLQFPGLTLAVVAAPGHTFGSVCFFEAETGVLFAGDALLPEITANPIVELAAPPEEMRQSLVKLQGSLRELRRLPITLAYPGHGDPIRSHVPLIDRQLAHIAQRGHRICELLGDRRLTTVALAREAFPRVRGYAEFLALCEALGHLGLLEQQGRVLVQETDGVYFWRRCGAA